MSAGTQQQWAALFHKALMPGDDGLELETEDGMRKILMKLAEQLRGGDQWGFQVACLEVAVQIDNGDEEAWSELGGCYKERGRRMGGIQMHEESLAAFQHALKQRPESHPQHAQSLDNVAYAPLYTIFMHEIWMDPAVFIHESMGRCYSRLHA
jgi:tetratricopeptide (TPR) repeat protein